VARDEECRIAEDVPPRRRATPDDVAASRQAGAVDCLPGSNRIGRRVGPCTWNALRGSHGSSLASLKPFTRSRRSDRAIRASRRDSGAPRQK
jgi:hypothetical protein